MKKISFIIPIHNEQAILETEVQEMLHAMKGIVDPVQSEILLVENGSTDCTLELARALSRQDPLIRTIHLNQASYGKALKIGTLKSKATYLAIFNIDHWDMGFVKHAFYLCESGLYDIVIGSKTMSGANDLRPFIRKLITKSFNKLLRLVFGFQGTDTHGMKFFRRERILPIEQLCQTDREVFDTELLLRAQHRGLRIVEIPITCIEKRKSTYSILKRIPRTLKDLYVIYRIRHTL